MLTTWGVLSLLAAVLGFQLGRSHGWGIDATAIAPWGFVLLLLLTVALVVGVLVRYAAFIRTTTARLVPLPMHPERLVIPLRFTETEPPTRVPEPSYNCVLCGRPLTDPTSQARRVGTTCYQRHGPRYKMVTNPSHAAWLRRKAAAEAVKAQAQAAADSGYSQALSVYAADLRRWVDYRTSEEGVTAYKRYRRVSTNVHLATLLVAAVLSYLVASFNQLA